MLELPGPLKPIQAWFAANRLAETIILNVIVGLASWGLAELVLMPALGGRPVTPIWPPVGLAVAVLYLGGYRLLPGVALGSFLLASTRVPIHWAAMMGLAAVIQPVIDVRILRWLKFDDKLERVRDSVILSLVAGPAGAIVAALVAVTLQILNGQYRGDNFGYQLLLWCLRDWLGVMTTATLIFTWLNARPVQWTWPRIAEGIGLVLTLLLGAQLIFGLWGIFATRDVPIAFIFFPLVGWAGLRFGPQ